MDNPWIENTGECPVSGDTLVNIRLLNGYETLNAAVASDWDWTIDGCGGDIAYWRLHKAEEVQQEFKGLETAWDGPSIFQYPKTDKVTLYLKGKSPQEKAAKLFGSLFDKEITELDVLRIVSIYNSYKE